MLRRRLTQHTRTAVLWGLFVFAAMQLGLAVAIDHWLPKFRDPYYAYRAEKLRRRTLDSHSPALTVVMLGSSRVQNGFDPGELGEQLQRELGRGVVLFNFGVPACGPIFSLLYFERLRAEGIRPDLLLIEVMPTFLAAQPAAGRPEMPLESQLIGANRLRHDELALVERYGFPRDVFRNDWWRSWPVPCYGQRFTIISNLAPRLLPGEMRLDAASRIDDSGWTERKAKTITPELRQKALARAWSEHGWVLARFQLCQNACRAQRDLLARCRDEGIGAVLVLMPEAETFRNWYTPEAIEQVERHVDALSQEFAVPILDARRWVADEGFTDGHHLQANGATHFSERLGHDVLAPLLALDAAERREYLASWARDDLESIAAGGGQERRPLRQAADPRRTLR